MTDKSAYGGLFQDPPYLAMTSDHQTVSSRYLGKRMTTHFPFMGQHIDGYFEGKFLSLASHDQNDEAEQILNKKRKTKKNKKLPVVKVPKISEKEFRYPSFPQKSTGPGSFYGCFQDHPFEYMTEPWEDPKKKKKKKKEKPSAPPGKVLPNVKTNPPKKGTYGVPGLLLEKQQYNDDWRGDLAALEKFIQKREKNKRPPAKPLGGAFRISGVSHMYFDEQLNTGVPGIYNAYEAPPAKGKRGKKKEKLPPKPIHEKPFKMAGVASGIVGDYGKFPNTWDDPAAFNVGKKSRSKKKAPDDGRIKNAPQWKPNSFEKTSVISSLLRRFY